MKSSCVHKQMRTGILLAVVLLTVGAGVPTWGTVYTVTDLGDLQGGSSTTHATDINNAGQVVGYAYTPQHAFVWDATNGMRDLNSLLGPSAADWSLFDAHGINDSGQVVGTGIVGGASQGFIWSGEGNIAGIGVLPGGSSSHAYDINNAGRVVGSSSGSIPGSAGPVSWTSDGGITGLGGGGTAYSINNVGQVTGWAGSEGALWTSNGGMVALPFLPEDINDSGQVVGWRSDAPGEGGRACLWTSDGVLTYLGDLPGGKNESYAFGMNNSGQVVGSSANDRGTQAYIWDATNGMWDLNTLLDAGSVGWWLQYAEAINDSGAIVGWGRNPSGVIHAFVATPGSGQAPGAVPEPSSWALLACNGLFVVGMLRRKRKA